MLWRFDCQRTLVNDLMAVKSINNVVAVVNRELRARNIQEGKYLTFSLNSDEFGISILKIKEIIGMMLITPVPARSRYMKGVINLRGKLHPRCRSETNILLGRNSLFRTVMHHRS